MFICVYLWLPIGIARADAVKLSGFWINDVTIHLVDQGRLTYTTRTGGEVTKPLTDVQGIKLSLYPKIGQAMAAQSEGNPGRAAELLAQVKRDAREAWIRHYAARLLTVAQSDAGQAVPAVRSYVELTLARVGPFFMPPAPLDAVRQASAEDKRQVADMIKPVLSRAAASDRKALEALLAAATEDARKTASPAAAGAPPAPSASPSGATGSLSANARLATGSSQPDMAAKAATPTVPSAITLPTTIGPGPMVNLLREGKFKEALAQLNQRLQKPGDLTRNLYLKGMAQLGLADRTGDRDAYLDAGLSFMRVVTYFPDSELFAPALLETGYVHHKIGRDDLARKLYDRVRPLIDPQTDPAYYQRLMKLESREKKARKQESKKSE